MPLYEYQCSECKGSFEELVMTSTAAAEISCPKCGSRQVRRKVSIFASRSAGSASAAAPPASSCSSGGT